ncbi:MAG: tRNA1(Val) (adenine(37)-N6)-methyltransferase [Clostridiaceae bacterium]|nr:tRNA1(Val) (adenine(37)-N6)-methyltransferase [Clostridiaceae bacterium]
MENKLVLQHERVDDLQIALSNGKNLCIIQNPKYFCFGLDAVLLANFARIPKNAEVADIGCGGGVIPLILAAKTNAKHIIGLEIQEDVAQMAQRSVKLNDLDNRITIEAVDIKQYVNPAYFDVLTCNPPYKEKGSGLKNPNLHHAIARHEICCTLADIIKAASQLLKPNGRLNIIHRPQRLVDIICTMREYKIEPKRIRFVYPKPHKVATSLLIEGIKNSNPNLLFEPPLYIYDENGNYTLELMDTVKD